MSPLCKKAYYAGNGTGQFPIMQHCCPETVHLCGQAFAKILCSVVFVKPAELMGISDYKLHLHLFTFLLFLCKKKLVKPLSSDLVDLLDDSKGTLMLLYVAMEKNLSTKFLYIVASLQSFFPYSYYLSSLCTTCIALDTLQDFMQQIDNQGDTKLISSIYVACKQ